MSSLSFEDFMESVNKIKEYENKFTCCDYKIFEDVNMVDVKTYIVNRDWKERFFTLPWKPWVKVKSAERIIPKQEIYIIKNQGVYNVERVLVCHPFMMERLKRLIKISNGDNGVLERYLNLYNNG